MCISTPPIFGKKKSDTMQMRCWVNFVSFLSSADWFFDAIITDESDYFLIIVWCQLNKFLKYF